MSKKHLDVQCDHCGAGEVHADLSDERVIIRCGACRRTIFTYYIDPRKKKAGRSTEADLLASLPRPTQAVYRYIKRYIDEYGYAPTRREIATGLGWHSANTTTYHLEALAERGLVEVDFGTARGIRLPYAA